MRFLKTIKRLAFHWNLVKEKFEVSWSPKQNKHFYLLKIIYFKILFTCDLTIISFLQNLLFKNSIAISLLYCVNANPWIYFKAVPFQKFFNNSISLHLIASHLRIWPLPIAPFIPAKFHICHRKLHSELRQPYMRIILWFSLFCGHNIWGIQFIFVKKTSI